MARSEARLAVTIWTDPHFRALSPTAQRMYLFLLSQPDLAHDGVIALRERRWSTAAAGMTLADIDADLNELAATHFLVIDHDTEELLIRSFIRRDKVYRQPNVLRAAQDHLSAIASHTILAAIGVELRRVIGAGDMPGGSAGIAAEMLAYIGETTGNPCPDPSGNPSTDAMRRVGDDEPGKGPGGSDADPHKVEPTTLKNDVSAGKEGSGNPFPNPCRKGPGERGRVKTVSEDSPDPVPRSPDPVPREPALRAQRASARNERATRIPDDFSVTPDMVAWAAERTPNVDGRHETEKFINYWRAKSGSAATKLDWPATWRNWMLTATERASPRSTPGSPPALHSTGRPSTTDQRVAAGLALAARLDAQTGLPRAALTPQKHPGVFLPRSATAGTGGYGHARAVSGPVLADCDQGGHP